MTVHSIPIRSCLLETGKICVQAQFANRLVLTTATFTLIEHIFSVQIVSTRKPGLHTGSRMRQVSQSSLVQHLCAGTEKTRQGSARFTHGAPKNTHRHPPLMHATASPLALCYLHASVGLFDRNPFSIGGRVAACVSTSTENVP